MRMAHLFASPSLPACRGWTRLLPGAAAACLVAAASAASALAADAPALANGVEPAKDLKPASTRYVVTNATPLYRAPAYDPEGQTGQMLARGERPQILGEANMGAFLLVGRDGRGVGYVPRSLVCPVDLCPNVEG